jgi:hypothetical protein
MRARRRWRYEEHSFGGHRARARVGRRVRQRRRAPGGRLCCWAEPSAPASWLVVSLWPESSSGRGSPLHVGRPKGTRYGVQMDSDASTVWQVSGAGQSFDVVVQLCRHAPSARPASEIGEQVDPAAHPGPPSGESGARSAHAGRQADLEPNSTHVNPKSHKAPTPPSMRRFWHGWFGAVVPDCSHRSAPGCVG